MFKLNNQPFNVDVAQTIGDVQFPAGFFRDPEAREAHGIVEIAVQVRPDDTWYWVTDNGDGTFEATPKDLAALRNLAIQKVRAQRQAALDSFPRSAGVSEVYSENLKAAQALLAAQGGTLMRDGSTAQAYLESMAAGMGITATQFAQYVVTENTAAAVKAREIEAEYVRLAYSYIPGCTFEQVQTVAAEFAEYCKARTA